jgi:hypothetical protein
MNSWIFQARPDRFDVQNYISEFRRVYWSVGHIALGSSVAIGDEVFIWKAYGKPRDFAGVVAHGFIVEPPTEKKLIQIPQNLGDNYWRGAAAERSTVKAGVQLNDVRPTLSKGALRRELLMEDKVLSESQIIKARTGTIFLLNPKQASRLRELWTKSQPPFEAEASPVKGTKNPPWKREELLLALELYMRNRKSPPSKTSREVESLSKELNQLRARTGSRGSSSFRNTDGVYLKMMNFRSYDPDYTSQGKVGMRHGNKLDPVVWNEFFGKEEELFKACRAIREALKESPEDADADAVGSVAKADSDLVSEVAVESSNTEKAFVEPSREPYETERKEAKLIADFVAWSRLAGREFKRLKIVPKGEGEPIFSDLYSKKAGQLIEAKGSVSRDAIRMAIGQIYDYRRFAEPGIGLAILLPALPRPDLVELIQSSGIRIIYRTENGFAILEDPANRWPAR